MRILIVGDELVSREKMDRLIRSLGHETLVATDGMEGWKIWKNERTRMVITDWVMPGIDGLGLCRKIREAEESQYTYLIMVTSKNDIHDIAAGIDAGADYFITEPFVKEELAVRIRTGKRILDFESRLGDLVEKRTAELTRANKELRREIAERKRAEKEKEDIQKQLLQAQKMESLGTLAGGIAHDFNNILSAIFGYTELARYEFPEGTSQRSKMEGVLKAAHRARDLVEQILAFSRQSGQEKKPLKIGPIVKETCKLLRASLPTSIAVRQNIQPESGTVLANPAQIHQILMNLCTNAAHAMRKKEGVLKVSLVEVELDSEAAAHHVDLEPGPYLKLTISDTGHGMNSSVMERIFDPYFTTKAPGEGTGLGLAVTHGIVKSLGGNISVHSQPGEGTSFDVLLKRIESQETVKAETTEKPPTGNERVLFVDDEESLANLGKDILELLGYEAISTTSSVEALEVFRANPDRFDLVVTDQTMPNMTGMELAKKLLDIRQDIPLILCTGYSELITGEKAREIGIRQFIMKPLGIDDLARIVRKALDEG